MLPILLLFVTITIVHGNISCYDDSGEPVDWFIVYKLPKPHRSSREAGMQYMYLDESTKGWVKGKSLMNDTEGAVGRTVQQLYAEGAGRQEETAYVLYNDQPPTDHSSSSRGHTKGVVLLDSTQGLWMLHSTPHFPPSLSEKKYDWPESGLPNGQTFLCVTYPYSQFKKIGHQLLFTYPEVYDSRVEGTFAEDLVALLNASEGQHIEEEPWNSSVALTSLGGKEFISFAKFGFFHDDLYSGWLAQALSSDLLVQFWLRSTGILPSNCSGDFRIYNMESLAFPDPKITFVSKVDHSKWCVSKVDDSKWRVGTKSDPVWACVGDMNRNQAEEHRGGGAICCRDSAIWKAFISLVQNYTDCDDTEYCANTANCPKHSL